MVYCAFFSPIAFDWNAGLGKDLSHDEADFNMVLPPLTSFQVPLLKSVYHRGYDQPFLKEQDTNLVVGCMKKG